MKMPEDCPHENVRTFRSVPPHSKCLDCGALVERRWVHPASERIVAARLQQAEAERDALAERLARVEALADDWNAVPDYTASTYDQGRVDQRHDMTQDLYAALAPQEARDG